MSGGRSGETQGKIIGTGLVEHLGTGPKNEATDQSTGGPPDVDAEEMSTARSVAGNRRDDHNGIRSS